jgi:predicted molibdopterin-dependent oxidoreductase YjgC
MAEAAPGPMREPMIEVMPMPMPMTKSMPSPVNPLPPRPTRIRLTIDGRAVEVDEGSTVAAALVVAGVRATRRSVSGEPRAAFCGMGVCQECRVTIDARAHVLACQTLCRAGQSVLTDDREARR